VGRYAKDKGISTLADAYRLYQRDFDGERPLKCYGVGDQEALLRGIPGLEVRGYTSHDDLVAECRTAAAFVLPAIYDACPLVVHEMCLIGLPLLLSCNVGNRHIFLIEGFNGFCFDADDPVDLAKAFRRFDELSLAEIRQFAANSRLLGTQHHPRFTAASLLSIRFAAA
jgi:glycosyltransferase involved in cell wall biosynthesis